MYESGVSVVARIILIILVVALGVLFILTSGCSCNCANAQELQITTQNGLTHSFF